MMLRACLLILQIANLLTSYTCDFESQSARDAWTINPGRDGLLCANRWYMGSAGANLGQYGMYISFDSVSAQYTPTVVGGATAYTELHLMPGSYTLSFDWYVAGMQKDTTGEFLDRLYVCWIPSYDVDGDTVMINSNRRALPDYATTYALQPDNSKQKYLAGSRSWSTATITMDSLTCFVPGKGPYRLAFVWTNGDSMAVNPPALIDNIEIQPLHWCDAPTNIRYKLLDNDVQLEWDGTAEQYEYRCYSYESKRVYSSLTDGDSVVISNLPEGRIDFYVRALCGEEHSPYISTSGLIYYPGKRCINFLDINASNCYIATSTYQHTDDPITYKNALVDFGPESSYSRHTVHYNRSETDPNTNNMLRTVPTDELASVRLGNWRSEGESERVEYQLHIDAAVNPVLVLKYAIVMENPDGHKSTEQPRFMLRILKNGVSVHNSCAEADFTADNVNPDEDPSWHRWNPGTLGASDIVWKDWTTVGVDLSEFDGEDLVVQLTTFDCSLNAHFGYAYFTLSCSDGKFKDMACGQINPIFKAPDGFLYRWYQKDKPTHILSRADTLLVGYTDTLTYGCDMMFPKDTTCYFTLYASAMARFPIPEMKYTVKQQSSANNNECVQVVTFYERSHILIQNHVSGRAIHDYSIYPDDTYWRFEDGTTWHNIDTYTKEFPLSGGTFYITMDAIYQTCDSTIRDSIVLPDLAARYDSVQKNLCRDQLPYIYPSEDAPNPIQIDHEGEYVYVLYNQLGCDSVVTQIQVQILDNIVAQRWNDVLAVRNATYNGGLTFVAFQWMKNGVEIPNATSSILYQPEGLDTLAQYTVQLTCDDGTSFTSCPYHPLAIQSQDIPMVLDRGQSLLLLGIGKATFVTPVGQPLSEQYYHNSSIQVPDKSGIYILKQSDGRGVNQTNRIIVK